MISKVKLKERKIYSAYRTPKTDHLSTRPVSTGCWVLVISERDFHTESLMTLEPLCCVLKTNPTLLLPLAIVHEILLSDSLLASSCEACCLGLHVLRSWFAMTCHVLVRSRFGTVSVIAEVFPVPSESRPRRYHSAGHIALISLAHWQSHFTHCAFFIMDFQSSV